MLNDKKLSPGGLIVSNDSSPISEPEPGLRRQVLAHTPAMMLIRHTMTKGWRGAAHAHPHEQLVYVVSGRIGGAVTGLHLRPARARASLSVPKWSTWRVRLRIP